VAVASAGPYANLHLAQRHNHASIPPISFLQAGCPSCHPSNSIKALEADSPGQSPVGCEMVLIVVIVVFL